MGRSTLPICRPDRLCWAAGLDNRFRRWVAPARRDIDLLDPHPGETVADLGAGPGFFDEEILRRIGPSGRLILADIDDDNLGIARRRFASDPRVRAVTTSAAHLEAVPSGSVDRALLSLVLCCLNDKSGALSETWRILKVGGLALVTFPRVGFLGGIRRRPLAVTRSRWEAVSRELPWAERPVRSGWVVERHVIVRTGGDSIATTGP